LKENKEKPKIAVIIPCYNEEVTVGKVVKDFKSVLPDSIIYVCDNNSSDKTAEKAKDAGAIVVHEKRQGKAHAVKRLFREVEADYYIMVDGDDTYDASVAPDMLKLAIDYNYDLVNCIRNEVSENSNAYPAGHKFGNRLLTGMVKIIFGSLVEDVLSGYKVLSRRFVKSFPILSVGFDIETEIAINALELELPISHVKGNYKSRPPGSNSKLRTFKDGFRILLLILSLLKHERPLQLFGFISIVFFIISLALGVPVILEYIHTGLVRRFPTAFLSMGIMLLSFFSISTGIILDTVTRGRKEMRMLVYLQVGTLRNETQH
jgi:glycosyltransferase involved in cell wall biosynthesis